MKRRLIEVGVVVCALGLVACQSGVPEPGESANPAISSEVLAPSYQSQAPQSSMPVETSAGSDGAPAAGASVTETTPDVTVPSATTPAPEEVPPASGSSRSSIPPIGVSPFSAPEVDHSNASSSDSSVNPGEMESDESGIEQAPTVTQESAAAPAPGPVAA